MSHFQFSHQFRILNYFADFWRENSKSNFVARFARNVVKWDFFEEFSTTVLISWLFLRVVMKRYIQELDMNWWHQVIIKLIKVKGMQERSKSNKITIQCFALFDSCARAMKRECMIRIRYENIFNVLLAFFQWNNFTQCLEITQKV